MTEQIVYVVMAVGREGDPYLHSVWSAREAADRAADRLDYAEVQGRVVDEGKPWVRP